MRLIDADAIHSTLADWQLMLSETYGTNDEFVRCLEDVLYTVDNTPTIAAPCWHKVEEPPKEDGWYILGFLSRWRNGSWWIPEFPDYWMTAGAPKEDA